MSTPAPRPEPGGPSATRTVLGRGSLYTVATAGPALAAVAVVPFVTRLLPVAEYDLVSVATVVVQVAFILVALGLGAAITRQYILAADGARGARGLVLQGAAVATVATGLLVATAPWWSPAILGRPVSVEIVLALVSGLGGAWMVLAQSYLRGADRPGPFVLIAVGASLLGPVLGVVGVLGVDARASVYLAGVTLGYLVAGVGGLLVVLRSGPALLGWQGLRAALRVGVPTVPHQVSLYLALAGLVVVADRVLGEGGRANVALTIGAGATVVTAGLNNAWAPVVYRAAPEQRGRVLDETTRVIAVVSVVVAGGVALLAPWLVAVAAPADYRPDGLVGAVAFACAAALPSVLYLASGHLVFARGRTGWLALSTPSAVAGGLLAATLLAREVGLTGIGLGYLVAYLLLAGLTTLVQRRVAEHPWWPPAMAVTVASWALVTAAGVLLPTTGALASLRLVAAVALAVLGVLGARRAARGSWRPATLATDVPAPR